MSDLLDIEDDLSRLQSLLLLLKMATTDLNKEERDAMYIGLDQATERASDIADRLHAMRKDSTSGC